MDAHADPASDLTVPATDVAPAISVEEAGEVVRQHFGIEGSVSSLPSERDQNFLISKTPKGEFVLKVANVKEDILTLEAQNAVLERLQTADNSLVLPAVCQSIHGRMIENVHVPSGTFFMRLVTFVPGTPLGEIQETPSVAFELTGELLATFAVALQGFSHPGVPTNFHWDLMHADYVIAKYSPLLSHDQQILVDLFAERFRRNVVPRLSELSVGVIHNDANDHNVIIDQDSSNASVALIDFGDMVHSCLVFDPAVAAAYATFYDDESFANSKAVIRGYQETRPLSPLEASLLGWLVPVRLCLSGVIGAFQKKNSPQNEYLDISQKRVWESLETLAAVTAQDVQTMFCEELNEI